MSRPVLLASMPSAGSDWLADCFLRSHPQHTYWREFFSPLANWTYSKPLECLFGDILSLSHLNLFRDLSPQELSVVLAGTWHRESATCTKDVYLAHNLHVFAPHFDVVVMLRRETDTFPPNRRRVIQWYEHFAAAAAEAGFLDRVDLQCSTPARRAVLGHRVMVERMQATAGQAGIPVLWWHYLMSDAESTIATSLSQLAAVTDPERMAREIVVTRQYVPRPTEHAAQWEGAFA